MTRPARRIALTLGLSLLAACAPVPNVRVDLDDAPMAMRRTPRLTCPISLGSLRDARPEGERAGQLGRYVFAIDEPAVLLRRTLAESGLVESGEARARVDLRILRLYMATQYEVKIPTAVLEARVDGGKPVLLRSQASSIAWTVSAEAGAAAMAKALGQTRDQLIGHLNLSCPAARPLAAGRP